MTLVATLAAPVPIITENDIQTDSFNSCPNLDYVSRENQPNSVQDSAAVAEPLGATPELGVSELATPFDNDSRKKGSLTSEQVMWATVNRYRKRLSAVEEIDLVRRAKTNSKDCDLLIRRMMWLPVFRANGVAVGAKRSHFADMVQEGAIGLLKALERFEPDSGARFSTYAKSYVTGRIYAYLRSSIGIIPMAESEQAAGRGKKKDEAALSGKLSNKDRVEVSEPDAQDSDEQDNESDSTAQSGLIDTDSMAIGNHVWYANERYLESIPAPESCRCHSALGMLLHSTIKKYLLPWERAALESLIYLEEPLEAIARDLGIRVEDVRFKKHQILKKLSSDSVRAKVKPSLDELSALAGCGSSGCIWPVN